jgi:hypothetical protein
MGTSPIEFPIHQLLRISKAGGVLPGAYIGAGFCQQVCFCIFRIGLFL